MNEALASLSKTDGVIGVVVFDTQGNCVANDLPPPYEPILLAEVIKRLQAAFDAFSTLDQGDVSSFGVDCEDGSLVLRKVDQCWVLALTHPDVNTSMLNVAMNVVVLNLSRQPHSGTHRAVRPSSDSLVMRSASPVSVTGSSDDLEIPPDAVDRVVIQQLAVVYQEFLGPAAKAVVKQQLAALGVTSRTLRRGQLNDFIARLAAKVPSPERQREFTSAAHKLQERMLIK